MFRECSFIKTDGVKCHSPAMRGAWLCFFHARPRRRGFVAGGSVDRPFDLPNLNEPGMTPVALQEILSGLAAGRISSQRAGVLLYGLQLAAQNPPRVAVRPAPPPARPEDRRQSASPVRGPRSTVYDGR